jgi:hypothetical protein
MVNDEVTAINTKLYIVEGPPCSGKSETARYIAELLAESGRAASFHDENDMDHPADYTFHAYMTEEQVKALSLEERRQLYSESFQAGGGYVVPLTKISVSLFGKVIPYKIYEKLDWETEKPVMLERWQDFAEKARVSAGSNVFCGCLLQNPVSETMMRFGFSYPEISAHIQDISRLIAPLRPAVVYLRVTDLRALIEDASGSRNAVWLSSAVTYHTTQGYGKRSGLAGFDGYVACLEARQKTELEILEGLPVKKLVLTDPQLDWDAARGEIAAFVTGKTLQKT